MTFLPENYEPPTGGGAYLKLQQGENRLRILSKPLIGWEMWVDGRPYRYPYTGKPDSVGETSPREFWAMVAWSYDSEKIQLFHVTQGSIKKAIRDLALDSGWGSPVSYDLRIMRTGHQLKTSYSVTPQPKSPLPQEVKQAFRDTPCWLGALLTGDDPFADGRHETPLWEVEEKPFSAISNSQYKVLVDLIGDDKEYLQKVEDGVKAKFGIGSLRELPTDHYDKVLNQVNLHAKERLDQEMADELPF